MDIDFAKIIAALKERKVGAAAAAAVSLCGLVLAFELPAWAIALGSKYPDYAVKIVICAIVGIAFFVLWVYVLYPQYVWDRKLQCHKRKSDGLRVCPSCQTLGRISFLRKGARYYTCPTVGCKQVLLDPDAPPLETNRVPVTKVRMSGTWMSE